MRRRADIATPLALALCTLVLTTGLCACTPWPGYATGGLAERHPTESPAIVVLDNRFESLVASGSMRRAAGRMTEANLLLTRARREYAAGLFEDADHSIAKVDLLLTTLERDIAPRRARAAARSGS